MKPVQSQKDLGIMMTSDARFKEHIYSQLSKANKMLGVIRSTLKNSSDEFIPTFRSLYLAFVRSQLEYASEMWSPKSVTLIKLLGGGGGGIQRRATSLLLPDLTYNQRLQKLKLLPLVHRRELKLKLKSGDLNLPSSKYFEFCSDERLRSYTSNKLKINSVKTELFKGTYFNRIPYLWNNLPKR